MIHESPETLRLQDPSALNITSRINSALDIIDLGLARARRPILTTKFGPQSAVLLHLVSRIRRDIPVIWIDTGYNTSETKAHAKVLTNMLDLDLHIYRPETPWAGSVPAFGDAQLEDFAERVKLEPLRRALDVHNPDIWVTALRREQSDFRDGLSPFQHSSQEILKVCPLIDWRDADMDAYLAINQLPSEPDYHDPTKPEPHLECGIHNRL